ERRLTKKSYCHTGTKVEQLVVFIMSRNVADRLEINLVEDSVIEMFNEEIFSNPPRYFGEQHAQEIFYEVRSNFRNVTWGSIVQALRDEFRVRLAKLSLAQAQVQAYQARKQQGSLHL